MALTIGTNSYVDGTFAGAHFKDTLRADEWSNLESATRNAALVEGFNYMQRLSYIGTKTDSAQVPAWPRSGIADIDSAEVPDVIKVAQCEIAIRLAADPSLIDAIRDTTQSNIKSVKAGGVAVEFFSPTQGSPLFGWVNSLIAHLLEGSGSVGGAGGIGGGARASGLGGDCDDRFDFSSNEFGVG